MTKRSDFLTDGIEFRDLMACQVMESDVISYLNAMAEPAKML